VVKRWRGRELKPVGKAMMIKVKRRKWK